MKILIVDDDAIVLESCRRVLESEGMAVRLAGDVDEALSVMAVEASFDLILTDIKMPGNDGFQLIRLVRGSSPESAILMMTGYLIPASVQKGTQRGADGFIAKPFTPEELISSVYGAICRRKGRKV
ncbi:response regulator [Desulfoluna sp.]|uniref:response regulator n=1 Tax=Desulfoluna sp. TaxID=2045199 RepID=UPI00262DC0CD|nr:response regulator [Desulfoluna sp.]